MLPRLMLAVGVSDAHPEQLRLETNTHIPEGREGGIKEEEQKEIRSHREE